MPFLQGPNPLAAKMRSDRTKSSDSGLLITNDVEPRDGSDDPSYLNGASQTTDIQAVASL